MSPIPILPSDRSESFEFLRKPCKLSFLRKQESSPFKTFWIPAFAGMTKWGTFFKGLEAILSLFFRMQFKKDFPMAFYPRFEIKTSDRPPSGRIGKGLIILDDLDDGLRQL
jgi:hypothetical protein